MKDPFGRMDDCARALAELWPRVPQANVRVLDEYRNARRAAVRVDGVMVSAILQVECVDGELWAHLSVGNVSGKRVPTWQELRWCKEYFLGADRKAIQVLPSREQWVNINPYVLHLYSPLERDPLPDFRMLDAAGAVGI